MNHAARGSANSRLALVPLQSASRLMKQGYYQGGCERYHGKPRFIVGSVRSSNPRNKRLGASKDRRACCASTLVLVVERPTVCHTLEGKPIDGRSHSKQGSEAGLNPRVRCADSEYGLLAPCPVDLSKEEMPSVKSDRRRRPLPRDNFTYLNEPSMFDLGSWSGQSQICMTCEGIGVIPSEK